MTVHLTQQDTRLMYEDALPLTHQWATCRTLHLEGDPIDVDDTNPVTAWQVQIREDETGRTWEIDHDAVIAAMRTLVDNPAEYRLHDSIIKQIGLVLAATDNEAATDEVCQLDVIGFDAIVQVATLGQVTY